MHNVITPFFIYSATANSALSTRKLQHPALSAHQAVPSVTHPPLDTLLAPSRRVCSTPKEISTGGAIKKQIQAKAFVQRLPPISPSPLHPSFPPISPPTTSGGHAKLCLYTTQTLVNGKEIRRRNKDKSNKKLLSYDPIFSFTCFQLLCTTFINIHTSIYTNLL